MVELARVAGIDPKRFYVGADFTGADLRGQDLSGLDLTGATLDDCILDAKTIIEPQFDPRRAEGVHRRSVTIPRNLGVILRIFENESFYSYSGWAIKRLLEIHYRQSNPTESARWLEVLKESPSFRALIDQQGAQRYSLKLDDRFYQAALEGYNAIGSTAKSLRMAVFVGAMKFWNVQPHDLVELESIIDVFDKIALNSGTRQLLNNLRLGWMERRPAILL